MSERLPERCELLVVGGGIQGACVARDAAGRGVDVLLVEQDDLAAHTSSASSKLAHGGLRYLEQGHLRLVREALREREILLRAAPHLVRPLRFLLPLGPGSRPAWLLRLGLFVYDHLGGARSLPGTERVDLTRSPLGRELQPHLTRGFLYSDCQADDARLVLANARDAAARGARLATRTRLLEARREGALWRARLQPLHLDGSPRGAEHVLRARLLVNAAGPWVGRVLAGTATTREPPPLRLVQGSHLVVPRRRSGAHALLLQQPDGRVIFVIPMGEQHDMLGTTDHPVDAPPERAEPSADEVREILAAANAVLATPLTEADVVWRFAGVRALHDDRRASAQRVSRDDVLVLDAPDGAAPLLSIYGGKLTTARRVAERVLARLAPWLGSRTTPWTARAVLPGGALPHGDLAAAERALRAERPWLPPVLGRALLRRHGSELPAVLGDARALDDLGPELAPGLRARELERFVEHELACTADDVLWRRSKLGLLASPAQRAALEAALRERWPDRAPDPGPCRSAPPADPGRR